MKIGAYALPNAVFVAPMAGITDRPFRRLARRFGASLAVSEMVSARPELRASRKSLLRLDHAGEPGPVAVQIAGSDPLMLADAARFNADPGAEGAPRHRRRRHHDRPRRARPAVAVPRDHALPCNRGKAFAAEPARARRGACRTPRRALRSLWRRAGSARRSEAHRLGGTRT